MVDSFLEDANLGPVSYVRETINGMSSALSELLRVVLIADERCSIATVGTIYAYVDRVVSRLLMCAANSYRIGNRIQSPMCRCVFWRINLAE
jgi:hypothetical protein